MAGPHERIIADAARAALGPLGFRRKGRSRLWLADRSWWLVAVEFQPSAWSRGSYLNVGPHWLWSGTGDLTFDFGHRIAGFQEYKSDQQFAATVAILAGTAAAEARCLFERFGSLSAAADALSDEAGTQGTTRPGWVTFHAGVASGLAGRPDAAAELLRRIADDPATPAALFRGSAERLARLLPDPSSFRRQVAALIDGQRGALRLPALDAPFV